MAFKRVIIWRVGPLSWLLGLSQMSVLFSNKTIHSDFGNFEMPYRILSAIKNGDGFFVLLDPDDYLLDHEYKQLRLAGNPAIRNLRALDLMGTELWQAEMPETEDYYYQIQTNPLSAKSFSSYACELNSQTGAILKKTFFK